MPKYDALIIPADHAQPVRLESLDDGLDAQQAVVGGWIESLRSPDGAVGYCNEEGKILGLPVNRRAHIYFVKYGHNPADIIRGDVLIVGIRYEDGEVTDVPAEVSGEVLLIG